MNTSDEADKPEEVRHAPTEPMFTIVARPQEVDPLLLAMNPTKEVAYVYSIGGSSGTGKERARDYIVRIRETMVRQFEGFFTLEETAQVLADAYPSIDAKQMVLRMRRAHAEGKLVIRSGVDRLPLLESANALYFDALVKVSDIDAWLDALGAGYRFPKARTTAEQRQDDRLGTYRRAGFTPPKATERWQGVGQVAKQLNISRPTLTEDLKAALEREQDHKRASDALPH